MSPQYIRAFIPGGTFFFTVALLNRKENTLTENIQLLRQSFSKIRSTKPFIIDAMVVLPDHLHCIWTLPEGDADFSSRWKAIKTLFSKSIPKHEGLPARRKIKGERRIWQRRFWEHVIRDENDLKGHVEYIHYNPVKHGYVEHARDWPYSSFRRYVKSGIYQKDWGASEKIYALEME